MAHQNEAFRKTVMTPIHDDTTQQLLTVLKRDPETYNVSIYRWDSAQRKTVKEFEFLNVWGDWKEIVTSIIKQRYGDFYVFLPCIY